MKRPHIVVHQSDTAQRPQKLAAVRNNQRRKYRPVIHASSSSAHADPPRACAPANIEAEDRHETAEYPADDDQDRPGTGAYSSTQIRLPRHSLLYQIARRTHRMCPYQSRIGFLQVTGRSPTQGIRVRPALSRTAHSAAGGDSRLGRPAGRRQPFTPRVRPRSRSASTQLSTRR